MVKNFGGNKSKKQGRKFLNVTPQKNTRTADEEGEMYAVVNKLMGGKHCDVLCFDGKNRICVIRNKFSGRGKRDNTLVNGTWVLVGLRDWESRSDGKEFCDLLEVYNNADKEKLKSNTKLDFSIFTGSEAGEEEVEFANEETEYYEEAQANNNIDKFDLFTIDDNEEIDIDDI